MQHQKGYPLGCMQGDARMASHLPIILAVVPAYGNRQAGNQLSLTDMCVSRADSKYLCSYT